MNVASSLNDPVFHINQVKWRQNKHNIQDIQEYVMEIKCVYHYSLNLLVTFESKTLSKQWSSNICWAFFFFITETPRIIWKTIYTVSDKWRSHRSAFKVNLSSGPWTPRPELSGSALSASVLTFWMSCQQSTANCVRDYTLRAAAQRHKFLTGTISSPLYRALNPSPPAPPTPVSSDTTLPPSLPLLLHNSPGKAAALFSACSTY